jgi:phosphoserine phosphatase RsbU/P
VLATLFAAASFLYTGLWIYLTGWEPAVDLGVALEYADAPSSHFQITDIKEGSAAAQAGLRPGDQIVAVNGNSAGLLQAYSDAVERGKPCDVVKLAVKRPGVAGLMTIKVVLPPAPPLPLRTRLGQELYRLYPCLFLIVGFIVLYLRLEDRNAWLLALLLVGFVSVAPTHLLEVPMQFWMRGYFAFYGIATLLLLPAAFSFFFAVFPVASPLDRKLPWLKLALLLAAASLALVVGLMAVRVGTSGLVLTMVRGDPKGTVLPVLILANFVGGFSCGLTSLIWNSVRAPTPDAHRKIRVIVWGTALSLTLIVVQLAIGTSVRHGHISVTASQFVVLPLILIPLSFAYAVIKHRVLEIPVLLKRSARYVLVQCGFTVVLFVVAFSAIVLFTHVFSRLFQTQSNIGMALSAIFGIVLVWVSAPLVKRGTERIDRAFFRSAYDARVILQDLAEKARTVTDRRELATLINCHIEGALRPKSLVCYIETGESKLVAECGDVSPGLDTIPANLSLLAELRHRGRSWSPPPPESGASGDVAVLAPLGPDCMVPILGRENRLIGLLILGQRSSEEPYSGEDKRLLDSVASQAGIALESIRLAEKMAERMEAERRAALEMQIAKGVQAKLLPQEAPVLDTLDCAGQCIQTRSVGGDYYDFLELGQRHVGLVLGDVSGKGISAALLMANLQALLRSRCTGGSDGIPLELGSVNHELWKSSEPEYYVTLWRL